MTVGPKWPPRSASSSLIVETTKIDKLETGVGLMPSLIRYSRRKTGIGFLALILVVCVYIYFVPQKVCNALVISVVAGFVVMVLMYLLDPVTRGTTTSISCSVSLVTPS